MKTIVKKTAKPAAKKSAAPEGAGNENGDLASLVSKIGDKDTIYAMVIAAGIARLEHELPRAVNKAVANEIGRTTSAISVIVPNTKPNADLITELLGKCLHEVAPKIASVFNDCEVHIIESDGTVITESPKE